ncbi:FUSC family protein [Oceanobacillus halophilus]|uniref:Aromatic acid exporter family protein n=1 Tax=Oceanobacillus halophilus TaxID=930130 RepID=A0A495A6U0_9BACI|nr:aromatic acid exporter family protein [Oceanobacillus halophilus]RKQ35508.1 aromatic acid exporter family protein [Oceanobacillus halophilus]
MKRFRFIGSRIVKTGVSVFFTALICNLIGWPPVFAVITAIVTVEPTVSDSIKKGIIRFPASAIGSAYAVLFISLFGNSAITYTLAAVLTITTCYKLNLHAGLLVATLTAVAMIEVIHSNFLVSFFIRLGTTTIGLGVSTIVNMFILPPDYRKDIRKHVQHIANQTSTVLEILFRNILEKQEFAAGEKEMLRNLKNEILKTETLSRFQRDEAKYHPLAKSEKTKFLHIQEQLNCLRLIHDHIDNLVYTPLEKLAWTKEERNIIITAVKELAIILQNPLSYDEERQHKQQHEIMEIFWEDNKEITKSTKAHPTKFPPELILLYELISIYELVDQYFKIQEMQK